MSDSADPAPQSLTISETRPTEGGWKCFEAPGVQPYLRVEPLPFAAELAWPSRDTSRAIGSSCTLLIRRFPV